MMACNVAMNPLLPSAPVFVGVRIQQFDYALHGFIRLADHAGPRPPLPYFP